MRRKGWIGPIEWAAARRPLPGEEVCGDFPIAVDVGGTAALFGVADGLGHGTAAETAALRAEEVVSRCRAEPLDVLLQLCHRGLTDTRGAAITLTRIDFETDTLSWIGIGNVTADLVAKSAAGVNIRASALLSGGIVGYRIPQALATHQVSIAPGDLLVIATDGILEDHVRGIDFAAPAMSIAEHILDAYSRESDDALVLTARHRGVSS
jgi:phosphoserine phosphatase RsbX